MDYQSACDGFLIPGGMLNGKNNQSSLSMTRTSIHRQIGTCCNRVDLVNSTELAFGMRGGPSIRFLTVTSLVRYSFLYHNLPIFWGPSRVEEEYVDLYVSIFLPSLAVSNVVLQMTRRTTR
ncbi:hypothetical protein AVEN_203076-1 [Araneus ventricosus]|uniref:Uncharacterized protein n=1 Tax=Araneus ventricosus TaxID=182803 RepID=A0A4Y2E3T3_ARAVE|nr:hypothetical protein AVEN_249876-1 [Araneus ventricosus]GBM23782.1 hypothetical protein AVEN_203076-1 [Araneus ventricosus]